VDGVLNVLSLTGDDEATEWDRRFVAYTSEGRGPFVIRIAHGTRAGLERLAREFEVTWATTWMGDAGSILGPELGLGEDWPFIDMAEEIRLARAGEEVGETWKLPAIQRWAVGRDRPIAWVDDDLGPDAADWAERRSESGRPTLLVATSPFAGLTEGEVDALLEWRRSLGGAPNGP
jgi:hypothetical protein